VHRKLVRVIEIVAVAPDVAFVAQAPTFLPANGCTVLTATVRTAVHILARRMDDSFGSASVAPWPNIIRRWFARVATGTIAT
jgi:hypothetical protein